MGLSALPGVIAVIGFLMLLKDVFRLMTVYENHLTACFLFHVDPVFLLAGFSIGFLTAILCAALAARRAGRVSIVEALQRIGGRDRIGMLRAIGLSVPLVFSSCWVVANRMMQKTPVKSSLPG